MLPISAAEAVSPAINRTRQFLFAPPFQWGTFLKLCLVAAITEGIGTNFRSAFNNKSHAGNSIPNQVIFHFTPEMIAAIVFGSLLAIVIVIALAYLVTRLRFAYFYCLTTNTRAIRPGWNLYREQANRFFWMNIAVGICFLLMIGLMIIPFAPGFMRLFREMQAGGGPDYPLLMSLVLPLIPIMLLIILVAVLLDIVLRDWMLPHYALENATAGQAWAAVWERIRNEKGSFFVYTLLRLVLPVVAAMGIFLVLLIPMLVLLGSVAAVEWGIHAAFASTGGLSGMVGVILEVFVGLVALGFAIVIGISIGGPISTAIREYALVFYGGRYPTLGNVLFPPAAPMMGGAPAD